MCRSLRKCAPTQDTFVRPFHFSFRASRAPLISIGDGKKRKYKENYFYVIFHNKDCSGRFYDCKDIFFVKEKYVKSLLRKNRWQIW